MHIRLTLLFCIYTLMGSAQNFVDPNTPEDVLPYGNCLCKGWTLDFSDEFQEETLNCDKWTVNVSDRSRNQRPELGVFDWRWRAENVSIENGKLLLRVDKIDSNTMRNGSIFSKGKYETKYGYFEARVKVGDLKKGTHSAFWLQGDGMEVVTEDASNGAEIDIFESAWDDDYTKSVIHIDGYGNNHQANTKKYHTPDLFSKYHVFGMLWTERYIKIYYDGVLKVTYSDPKWHVLANEYLWLSNGASFGVSGDAYFKDHADGTLTYTYFDYVRVWKFNEDTISP